MILVFLRFSDSLNPYVVKVFTDIITPYWKMCLEHPKSFNIFYYIFLFTSSLSFTKPIFKFSYFIIRLISGSIISSVGILWSESLQSIDYLKSFANLVKDLLENYTDIKIPLNNNLKGSDDSIIITSFGLMVLGIIGIVGVVLISDYFIPDTVRTIPYLGGVIDNLNSLISSIYLDTKSYLTSWYDYLVSNNSTTNNNLPAPESISRSSSGSSSSGSTYSSSSTITLRDLRTPELPITPPLSRSSTPLPLPEDVVNNWE